MALVLLDELTEGTVTVLHVGEFIFVLDEEATTIFAHGDGDVGNHVFVVPFGHLRAKVRHVLDKDLFEAH